MQVARARLADMHANLCASSTNVLLSASSHPASHHAVAPHALFTLSQATPAPLSCPR